MSAVQQETGRKKLNKKAGCLETSCCRIEISTAGGHLYARRQPKDEPHKTAEDELEDTRLFV